MKKITGNVVYGIQKGRTLGFPTANIKIDLDVDPGIYAGRIIINKNEYDCALYFSGDSLVEAFIFNFADDLYGAKVSIEVFKKIRDKMIFKSDKEAIEQITKDVLSIKEFLNNNK